MKLLSRSLMACSVMVTLAVFMSSCNKDNAVQNTVIPTSESAKLQNVKEENGILMFNSKADLDAALSLVEGNQAKAQALLSEQFPNFVSATKAFNALNDVDYENILQADVTPATYSNYAMQVTQAREKYVIPVISASNFS